MSDTPQREMTLKEYVHRLPESHRAHKEYMKLLTEIERKDEVLKWYQENVGNCNRTTSIGEVARDKLAKDHGERAAKILSEEE